MQSNHLLRTRYFIPYFLAGAAFTFASVTPSNAMGSAGNPGDPGVTVSGSTTFNAGDTYTGSDGGVGGSSYIGGNGGQGGHGALVSGSAPASIDVESVNFVGGSGGSGGGGYDGGDGGQGGDGIHFTGAGSVVANINGGSFLGGSGGPGGVGDIGAGSMGVGGNALYNDSSTVNVHGGTFTAGTGSTNGYDFYLTGGTLDLFGDFSNLTSTSSTSATFTGTLANNNGIAGLENVTYTVYDNGGKFELNGAIAPVPEAATFVGFATILMAGGFMLLTRRRKSAAVAD